MGNHLYEAQVAKGAVFAGDIAVPMTFGQDAAARSAVKTGVAICDRSHWGRIRVSDSDRLRFLHNQTTNQIQMLQPGQGCDTVFVNSTGRTIDLAIACVEDESVLLFVSPQQAAPLIDWMDRYIFFADKVKLADATDSTVAFTLLGPDSLTLLSEFGVTDLDSLTHGDHRSITIADLPAHIIADSGLTLPGFTLVAAAEVGAALWTRLTAAGAVPLGEQVWQELRIADGRPMPGAELTEDYNPLEATLWQAVSFEKGCYIGQETIARLNTYQGVKQQLWGLRLEDIAVPGTAITHGDSKIGLLTSCVPTPDGVLGLGYIRTKAGGQGLPVTIGEVSAQVVAIPFATRGYLEA
jgi:folate-binding protein YgfZ